MNTFAGDLRYALRRVRRAPGLSLVAILTLALGIGATSAIFSIVNGVLLRPLPFPDSGELVRIFTVPPGVGGRENLSPPNFASLRDEARSFTDLAAYMEVRRTLIAGGEPVELDGAEVSAGFFEILRTLPIRGRTFRPDENQPGAIPTIVLAHETWQSLFAGDSTVTGRAVSLNGLTVQVVGVMPRGFDFPAAAAFWTPARHDAQFSPASIDGRRSNMWVPVLGRLRSGVGLDAALAELAAIAQRLEVRFPDSNTGVSFTARSLQDDLVGGARGPFLLLVAAVVLVLLIACANVTALLLAQATTRREELAVRVALGASQRRLMGQLMAEVLILAVAGGVLGLLIAAWGTHALVSLRPAGLPRLEAIRIDGAVVGFTIAIALAATILVGLLPARRAARSAVSGALREGGRGASGSRRDSSVRGALVIAEITAAVMLLSGAGLVVRSLVVLVSVDPGFKAEGGATFRVALPETAYPGDDVVRSTFDQLIARTSAVPGVESVGATSRLPLASGLFTSRFLAEGWPETAIGERGPSIAVRAVSPGYFGTMQIPVRQGRGILASDRETSMPVAVINETAARRYFPGESPIGKRLVWFSWDPAEGPVRTIVGIVGDIRHTALDADPEAEVYFPHMQVPLRTMNVVVRTKGEPRAVAASLRRELHALAPALPVPQVETLDSVLSASVSRPRLIAMMLALFAAVALVLASIGIFGLLSYNVAQRTREIGIRLALGAVPRDVVRLILVRAAALVAIGLAIGLGAALILARGLETFLFGVTPTDPVTLLAVLVLIGCSALAATLVPARRAAAVNPMQAMRGQ